MQEANALADHLEKENTFFKSGIHHRNRSTHGGGLILKFFGIMLLLAGLIACGIIGSYIWDDEQFIKRAIPVTGTVVDIERSETVDDEGRSSIGYYPVFEYSHKGMPYTHRSSINFGEDNYTISETVSMYVDPENNVIDTFTERWGYYLLFGAFALMFVGMAVP